MRFLLFQMGAMGASCSLSPWVQNVAMSASSTCYKGKTKGTKGLHLWLEMGNMALGPLAVGVGHLHGHAWCNVRLHCMHV